MTSATEWSVKRAQSMGVHVRELSDDRVGGIRTNRAANRRTS